MNDHPDLRSLYEDLTPPVGAAARLRTRLREPDLMETAVWVFTHRVAAGIAAAWILVGFLHVWPADPVQDPDVSAWVMVDTSLDDLLPETVSTLE